MESGSALRFVPPSPAENRYGDYEMRVFDSGRVETRPDSKHDLFNALAWLAFPKTKARLNALHAAEIPFENGRRGRFRDLLTLIDEGGAIVECGALHWDSKQGVKPGQVSDAHADGRKY